MLKIEEYASVTEVWEALEKEVKPSLRVETVSSRESFGRVSAEELVAMHDVPPVPTSHMDGFAVRWEDVKGSSVARRLEVVGEVRPGKSSAVTIGRMQAVRVSTGSPLPPGADTVIPVEHTTFDSGSLFVKVNVRKGAFVYGRGEDVRKGEVVLRKGQVVRAQDMARLISLGIKTVRVYARPKVAVIATGSELTDSAEPGGLSIPNSHGPMFAKLVVAAGCQPLEMGIVPDETDAILRTLRRAVKNCDMVLTLGGTSMGEHDLLEMAVSTLSPSVFYHGIRMDRGRVAGVAVVEGKPVIMMPGPVQGAMNSFLLFALPALRKVSGRERRDLSVSAKLARRWKARERFSNFSKVVYLTLERRGNEILAAPVVGETESINVLTRADGFTVLPEDITTLPRGSRVRVMFVPGFSFA